MDIDYLVSKPDIRKSILEKLAKNKKNPVCAEIGVWKGDFSETILQMLQPSYLILIDPWKKRDDYLNAWYGTKVTQEYLEAIYLSVKERFRIRPEVHIFRYSSTMAFSIIQDTLFDFIYIDGDHSYSQVKEDLELSFNHLKPDGVIMGDDYRSDKWFKDDVIRAVDEFSFGRKEIIADQYLIYR